MQQFSRVVARNSAFGMAAQFAIKLLSFGFSVLIVRNLGAESFGQYQAVLAFGAIFVFMADLGLGTYTVREIARLRDEPDGKELTASLFADVLSLRFLLAILTAITLIASAWLTNRPPMMIGAIALGTIGLIMFSLQGSSEAILAGYERLDRIAGAKVGQQLTFVVVGAVVLLLGMNYYGLIVANLLGIALLTIICWRAVRMVAVRPSRPLPGRWLSLLKASIPFGVIGFTLGLSYRFDTVLLNIYHGDADTGYYNAAYNLVFSATMLSNVLNTSIYPSLTRQAATDPTALPTIYERALRYLMMISIPIAIGGWALADEVIPFLFRPEYIPAIPALKIVIWVVPLMFVSEFLGYVVLVAGRERSVARSVMISTAFNVLCNLFAIPRFGLLGAAVMTVVTEMILVAQYLWILRNEMSHIRWANTFGRTALSAIGMGAIVLLLRIVSPHVMVTVAAGVLSYVTLLFVFGVIGKDEVRFFRSLRRPVAVVSE